MKVTAKGRVPDDRFVVTRYFKIFVNPDVDTTNQDWRYEHRELQVNSTNRKAPDGTHFAKRSNKGDRIGRRMLIFCLIGKRVNYLTAEGAWTKCSFDFHLSLYKMLSASSIERSESLRTLWHTKWPKGLRAIS